MTDLGSQREMEDAVRDSFPVALVNGVLLTDSNYIVLLEDADSSE